MGHKHSVYDSDAHFSINPITKVIKNESSKKTTLVQGDHNSERFSFDIPRFIEGHDMMLCDLVEVHYDNKETGTENVSSDYYEVKDKQISPEDENMVIFSWLIIDTATKYAGSLEFSIVFKCMENGVCTYKWGTNINTDISVAKGKDNSDVVVERSPNVVDQWRDEIFGNAENAVANINLAEKNALEAVKTEGAEQVEVVKATADGIVEERNRIHLNHALKASVIEGCAEGEVILLDDSAKQPFVGMNVFGKSTQDGTPTPDAPVEINSVENVAVKVCGKNLLAMANTQTLNGVTFAVDDNGIVTVNGTATATTYFFIDSIDLKAGETYVISGCPEGGSDDSYCLYVLKGQQDYVFETGTGKTFTCETDFTSNVRILIAEGQEMNNVRFYPMIHLASAIDTTYESPKAVQSIEISHTLHGIPVTSSGNYTDANGQQWICDEVDLEKRRFIQRIGIAVIDGSKAFAKNNAIDYDDNFVYFANKQTLGIDTLRHEGYCTHLPCVSNTSGGICVYLSSIPHVLYVDVKLLLNGDSSLNVSSNVNSALAKNPMTLYYILAEPIETALSDAEIEAFKALMTNYPTTTILNDSGANLAVLYGIDTKSYIDKKFAELQTAILAEK